MLPYHHYATINDPDMKLSHKINPLKSQALSCNNAE
jgi:hypothetical protein